MGIKQTLTFLALSAVVALGGCSGKYKEGKVIKEAGSIYQNKSLVESKGALFGNESVKAGEPSYVLQIKTEEGVYTASILYNPSQKKTLEALETVIEEGTKVRFLVEDRSKRFGNDRVGSVYSDDIEVLGE